MKPSLIDLMLGSPGFFEVPTFPGKCSVSFGESLGSNHTGLLVGLPLDWTPVAEQDPWAGVLMLAFRRHGLTGSMDRDTPPIRNPHPSQSSVRQL
jgi:hypothetical protein